MEAEQIILTAKKEQESIKADLMQEKLNWEQEKVNLIKEAKEEGYQAGWKEGESQGYAECQSYITNAQKVITAAKNDYHSYLESSERTILELALKIASKIVATKIEDDQEYFLSLVKKAVKEVKELFRSHKFMCIQINMNFYYLKKRNFDRFLLKIQISYIYPDSDLSEGSCLIESPSWSNRC